MHKLSVLQQTLKAQLLDIHIHKSFVSDGPTSLKQVNQCHLQEEKSLPPRAGKACHLRHVQ